MSGTVLTLMFPSLACQVSCQLQRYCLCVRGLVQPEGTSFRCRLASVDMGTSGSAHVHANTSMNASLHTLAYIHGCSRICTDSISPAGATQSRLGGC